ncbi:MAG: hypothetical protein U1U88_002017 [Lawsonella clevelandensis]
MWCGEPRVARIWFAIRSTTADVTSSTRSAASTSSSMSESNKQPIILHVIGDELKEGTHRRLHYVTITARLVEHRADGLLQIFPAFSSTAK